MSVRQAARLVVGRPAVSTVADVKTGDLIAPHLYDFAFYIGYQSYVYGNLDTTYGFTSTYIIRTKVENTQRENYVFSLRQSSTDVIQFSPCYFRRLFASVNFVEGWQQFGLSPFLTYENRFYVSGYIFDTSSKTITGFRDDIMFTPVSYTRTERSMNNYRIGAIKTAETLTISYSILYNQVKTQDTILNILNNIVDATNMILFIDPTFWDGTKYVDLSGSGNHAYPYNAPSRVPAERSFVHVVRGRFDDGVARVAVPPRCSFVIDGARQVNVSSSPVFVPVPVGRHLFAFESLDAEPWLVLKAPDRVVPASRTVSV
ncbi:MAG: hypothetical protein QXX12_00130 [Nanopusillaceae archaeon]